MTVAEKLAMLKALLKITNNDSDAELTVYLNFSKKELIAWRYGASANPPIARAIDSNGNYIKVNIGVFISALSPVSGSSYVFTYSELSGSWQYEIESVMTDVDLYDYGIELSDSVVPVDAETITIKYTEAPIAEYDTTQIMACVAGYGLQGLENQMASTENGVTRQFKYSDMLMYIRANVVPYVGVI